MKRKHWSITGHVFIPGLCRASRRSHCTMLLKGHRNRRLLFKGRRVAKGWPAIYYRRKYRWPPERGRLNYHPPGVRIECSGGGV